MPKLDHIDKSILSLLQENARISLSEISSTVQLSVSAVSERLRRLEGSGALEAYSVEHQGRLRRYYRITEEGKKQIGEFLLSKDTVLKVYQYIEERNRT